MENKEGPQSSVNGRSQWIGFHKKVAVAINLGPDNQYEIWSPRYCSAALDYVRKAGKPIKTSLNIPTNNPL